MQMQDWSGDPKRRRSVGMSPMGLSLLFFRLWLGWEVYDSEETPPWEIRLLLWYAIDVLFVIVSVTVGRYLLRSATAQAGG